MMHLLSTVRHSCQIRHYSFRQSLYIFTLAPTAAIMAYGAFISTSATIAQSAADQRSYAEKYILKYADGSKAIFETDEGVSVVMVGSSLSAAGRIVSIEKQNGRWTVSTSKHLTFAQR